MARTTSRAKTTATPWGAAHAVEQLTLQQRAGEKRFASLVQLLETDQGERLVRFAYTTDGATRRGPVTLRQRKHSALGHQAPINRTNVLGSYT